MPRQPNHISALDGIRGIAILIVLVCHSSHQIPELSPFDRLLKVVMTSGWVGVDLFFVLSGFLITGILIRTKQAPNFFQSFYARRFLRIFPVYYGVLTFVFLAIPHTGIASWLPPRSIDRVGYFLYLQNLPGFGQIGPGQPDLLHYFWSLAVEEQFYLVWPLLVLTLSARNLLRLCVGAIVGVLCVRVAIVAHWGVLPGFFFSTLTRCDGLFVGAALALLSQQRRISMRLIGIAAAVGLAAWVVILYLDPDALRTSAQDVLVLTFGTTALALLFGALLAFSQHKIEPLESILSSSLLRSLGKYSYGMYVFHMLIFVAAERALRGVLHYQVAPFSSVAGGLGFSAASIAVVYFVAKLSYHQFESRFLRLKRFFEADVREREPAANPGTPVTVEQ